MRFNTLTTAATTAVAISLVSAAPIYEQTEQTTEVTQDNTNSGFLQSFVSSLSFLVDFKEPVETPGEHWKNVGKDQKKHWKKVGKQYKKKYTPPTEEDSDVELMELEDGEEPVETPGEHWKRFGKDQKKHWKKVGKQYKKKYTPPTEEDSDVELMELEDGEEPVETPGEHWKNVGKDQKKHWKKVGKQNKKKYTPPAEEFDGSALL